MSNALKFVPPRVPLTDPRTGLISREWFLFFQGVFERIGGATGESTTDLTGSMFEDAGIEESKAFAFGVVQDLGQAPLPVQMNQDPTLSELQTSVQELRDLVAELLKEVQVLKQSPIL